MKIKTEYGMNSMAAPERKKADSVFQEGDVNAKRVFENPYLCAQFLRDYSNLEEFRDVQPEDIEKVKLRYHMFDEVEHNSDTVVRIRRNKGKEEPPIYIVALMDHKSQVDYNVAMQLLCYMVCIWKEWEKEMEKDYGISCQKKGFRYPIVFPVVYYEGSGKWTADLHLADRICMSDILPQFVPDFTYWVVRTHDYSNAELLERNDEISLVMLLNKIQRSGDFEEFRNGVYGDMDAILKDTPENVLILIAAIVKRLCRKLNVPEDETNDYISRIRGERDMGYFFENMEKMDIQEERRLRKEAQNQAKEAKSKANEAENKLKVAESKANEAENKLKVAESKANKAEDELNQMRGRLNDAERMYIETLKEMSLGRDEVKNRFMRSFAFDEEQAEERMKLFWQEAKSKSIEKQVE